VTRAHWTELRAYLRKTIADLVRSRVVLESQNQPIASHVAAERARTLREVGDKMDRTLRARRTREQVKQSRAGRS